MPQDGLLFAIGLLHALAPSLELGALAIAAVRAGLAACLGKIQDKAFNAVATGSKPPAPLAAASAHAAEDDDDGILPVVVKKSQPRTTLALLVYSLVALTLFLDGVVLVTRAITTGEWEEDSDPTCRLLEWYIVGSFGAWGMTLLRMAWQVRTMSDWTKGLPLAITLVATAADASLLGVLGAVFQRDYVGTKRALWPALHIACLSVRVLVLLFALLSATRLFTRTTYEPIAEADQPGYGTFAGQSAAQANGSADPTKPKAPATPPPLSYRDFAKRIRILSPYLWPSKSKTLQAVVIVCALIVLVGRVVNVLVPRQLGIVVADLTNERSPWAALAVYVGGGGILSALQSTLWTSVSQYSDRMMTQMCFDHLMNLSLAYHTRRKTGEVLRVLDRGSAINNFFQLVLFSFAPMLIDLVVAIVYLGAVFGLLLSATIGVVMVAYVAVSIILTRYRVKIRREMNEKDKYARGIHTDALMNWETVKFFTAESYESSRYFNAITDYQRSEYRVSVSLNFLNLSQNFILSAGVLVGTLILAYRVAVQKSASVGDFVVFISYLTQLTGPLNSLGTLYRVVQSNLTDTDNLVKLLDEQVEIADEPDALELLKVNGDIEFDDVSFSYDGKVSALKNISFKIPAGSSAAFVGESGGGKSTILRLLFRFYEVTSGRILVDGHDIRQVTQTSLRRNIGVVPQDASLMNASIEFNIAYGNPPSTRDRVVEVAKAAQIHDRVLTFADGYATVVGERGVRLSGGEKQRVALARTMLKDPPIIMLDEATSALDTATEREIQHALKDLSKGRTSLTIAHRLSTIVNADIIFCLKDGRIAESGKHADLVAQNGLFADLWSKQIRSEVESAAMAEQAKSADEATSPSRPFALAPNPPSEAPSPAPGRAA